jgi:hypothetical protein
MRRRRAWPIRARGARLVAAAWFLVLVLVPGFSAAQSMISDLAEAAKRSAEQLDPDRIADIESTRSDFLSANETLRVHLLRTTDQENAQAWLDYLEVEPLVDSIAAGARESEIAGKATRVSQKATGVDPGLEIPAVVGLRSAAETYSNALRFRRKERTTEALSKQLLQFAEDWSTMETDPTPDEIARLRLLMDLLQRTGQEVALVDRARTRFSSANLHVLVDDRVVQRGINRMVHQTSPVRDCILGTRIVGDALLTGDVTATLLPSIGSVRLQLALRGSVSSNSLGYNGPVRLRTTGVGQVHASRTVEVDESGLRFEPVVVNAASLTTRINAIEHPLRLVRKIARKRAAQQKPEADRIARGRLVSRISEAFTEETDAGAAKPMPDWMSKVRAYMRRLNLSEPARTIGSTSDFVFLNATVRQGNQLAAPTPPPAVTESHEATLQLHESVIENTLGATLAGRTMTRSELQELASRTGRGGDQQDPPSDAQEEESEFEIDFDRSRPIIFEARDGQLRIGIRGTRFAQGSRELKRQLEIAAVYRPVRTESGNLLLDRVGEVEINFPGTKQLSVTQAGLRGSIKKGFADAFPPILMDRPWTIPSTVESPSLQGRTFRPRYFDAQEGWLTLGVGS